MSRPDFDPRKNYYATLNVVPSAPSEVIDAAYKAMMRLFHPDHAKDKGAMAKLINEANDVLLDADRRREYDRARRDKKGLIGGYKLVKEIAEGGFGTTYEAEHVISGLPACVKHCANLAPVAAQILTDEARAAWDLRHFAFPAVRDLIRTEDGTLALVMSYVPRPTIEQAVQKRGRFDAEDVAWIADRILNGLSYAHYRGVVHGDIKPQNIILQPKEHTLVMVDFGLAAYKPKGGSRPIGFTETFSPPEQVNFTLPLGPWTDFYALGMTMIFALNGGDIRKTQNLDVPADLPDPMCNFIRELIRRDPNGRPDWKKGNVWERFQDVRRASFGQIHSGLKDLGV